MDPTDLSDSELAYELQIRGIADSVDRRVGTKALRIDISNEIKGLKPPLSLSPLIAKNCLINELRKECEGALDRKELVAQKVLNSKLLHYLGKIKRLGATDADEVARIENLNETVNRYLLRLDTQVGKKTSQAKNVNAVQQGAIPKTTQYSDSRSNIISNQDENLVVLDDEVINQNERRAVSQNRVRSNEFDFPPLMTQATQPPRNVSIGASNNANAAWPLISAPVNNNTAGRTSLPNRRSSVDFNVQTNDNERYSLHGNGFHQRMQHEADPSVGRHRAELGSYIANQGNGFHQPEPWNNQFQSRRPPINNRFSYQNINPRNQTNQTNFRNRRNPVSEWNISFSGDSREISLNDFLSQVSLLARAERLSDDDLLTSAVYLFKGSAYTWYRAFYPYYTTWAQLIAGLKEQFLPVDYDFWLMRELEQRRQGETENFGIYFAAMEMLFRNLSYTVSEQQRLQIVMRNMAPMYAERLALDNIRTLNELFVKCKRIEEVKYRISRQVVPQIQRRDLLEPAFSYMHVPAPRYRVAEMNSWNEEIEPDLVEISAIGNSAQRISLCYNCGEPGHRFSQCKVERKLFCYKCGASGFTASNCKRCQDRNQGNDYANPRKGEPGNSQH